MFGIGYNIKSKVRECTPELLNKVLDSPSVAKTCAELEDALEKCRRGELTKDEYETLKGELKKQLPIMTFHATFKHGRRKNEDAIPSGLSIYDIDHIPNPRAKWEEIEARKEELGIVVDVARKGKKVAIMCTEGNTPARVAYIVRNLKLLENPWFFFNGDESSLWVSVFHFGKNELRLY